MITCEKCFRRFSSQRLYDRHATFCATGKPAVFMPEEPVLKFKNFQYKFTCPAVMYADFEAYSISMSEKVGPKSSNIAEQKPTGFGYIIVSEHDKLRKPLKVYRGRDAAEMFVHCLMNECYDIENLLREVEPMVYTEDNMEQFLSAKTCSICSKSLNRDDSENPIVRDHCHISGILKKFKKIVFY